MKKGLLKRLKVVINEPTKFKLYLAKRVFNGLPDKQYLSIIYRLRMGRTLNLDHPKTFNEKLQWLKLHDHKPEYTMMVDKYEVRKYINEKIGEQYLIPLLGVWDSFDQIDFEQLPNQFVLKCTHDSGGLVFCSDKSKFDIAAAREKINWCLSRNFYKSGRERCYKDVRPRIIAEKFMVDESNVELRDYKIMCFNGVPRCSFTCSNRNTSGLCVNFYDLKWNEMPFERHYPKNPDGVPKPAGYDLMLELAQKLAVNIPFVRVDFYQVHNQVYFGELTFYPGSGMEEFTPEIYDEELGSWLNLGLKTITKSI